MLYVSARQAAGQQEGRRQMTWFLFLLVRSYLLAKVNPKVRL